MIFTRRTYRAAIKKSLDREYELFVSDWSPAINSAWSKQVFLTTRLLQRRNREIR